MPLAILGDKGLRDSEGRHGREFSRDKEGK